MSKLRGEFPKSMWQHTFETRIAPKVGKPLESETRDLGIRGLSLQDHDKTRVVQYRLDGFTLSVLRGYTSGDDLFAEAFRLWDHFVGAVQPTSAIRVALRYINRLMLPFRRGDPFEKYLSAPVEMPLETPQHVSEFLARVVAHPDASTSAIVTQRLQHGTEDGTPFVLDIDVFRPGSFSTESKDLLPILEELRILKNDLFFAFLTNEALEPYR